MSVLHAQQIITDHAAEMDDSLQAFAMLRLAVAVTDPNVRAKLNHHDDRSDS